MFPNLESKLLIFVVRSLGHAVGPCGVEDIKLLIEFQNVRTAVVGHHDISLTVQKHVVEPLVVLFGKLHFIAALRFKIRGIAVKEGVLPVILQDQALKVLVFNDNTGQPAGALPDQMEEAAEDAGMTVEKFTDAMEHVMSQLI